MKNNDTESLKYKSFYLNKISEKAKELADKVEEVYDAKHWLDMCREDLATTIEDQSEGDADAEDIESAKGRLARANQSMLNVMGNLLSLEIELRHFKDDVECLGTEVIKFTKD